MVSFITTSLIKNCVSQVEFETKIRKSRLSIRNHSGIIIVIFAPYF